MTARGRFLSHSKKRGCVGVCWVEVLFQLFLFLSLTMSSMILVHYVLLCFSLQLGDDGGLCEDGETTMVSNL